MGMVKREVKTEAVKATSPQPALPSFTTTAKDPETSSTAVTAPVKVQVALSKEMGMTRGGVAHDAAQIVAAMSAMKTTDEVKVLFTDVYHHILATVLEA